MVSEKSSLSCLHGRSLDDLLLETIGDVLKQVFGEKPAKIILRNIKKGYSLRWEEIPTKAQVFAGALQKILGSSGAVIIEDLIVEILYSKLKLEFKWKKGYGFSDYVRELGSKFGLTVEG